ncbi:MAG: hypothetical protein Q9227_003561 [Pyrenula ochraceoflavens]
MSAPFSDGTPQASQWPIPPLHYFDYEIHPSKGSAGTYFYHSHVGMQANTAAGSVVVDDQGPPPYAFDEERIVMLLDYFNRTDARMESLLTGNPGVWSGETNDVLVNGFGRQMGSLGDLSPHCSIQQWRIRPSTTYLFRFIGATGLSFTTLAFQGHDNLTIVEADGQYTKPQETSYLQIGSGQRYSVLLRTKSLQELATDDRTTYYMQLETRERPIVTTSFAALSYSKDASEFTTPPSHPPLVLPNTTYGWLDYALSSRTPDMTFPPSSAVDRTVHLQITQVARPLPTTPQIVWTLNNETPWFTSDSKTPYLIALYENATSAVPDYSLAVQQNGYDPQAHAFAAKVGEVIDIVFESIGLGRGQASNEDVHPMHIHGGHVWDLGSGNGTYDANAHHQKLSAALASGWNPAMRDTTMLFRPPGGGFADLGTKTNWRLWRIRVTDPGVWMLHCHTLAHMAIGMQSVWVMGNASELAPLPKDLAQGYLEFGGGAYGTEQKAAKVVHWFDD